MPRTTLLHREVSTKSLKTIVENAQRQRPPTNAGHDIDIRGGQLVLTRSPSVPRPKVAAPPSPHQSDEGFESDVDSISLMSADDSFTAKGRETDSANGSACSDSEGESGASPAAARATADAAEERFNLVNCVCYADIKYPDVLVFAIADEVLVFRFDNLDELQNFYSNFNTVKAVSNQRTYGTSAAATFNLLQRTDSNGMTHIEISRPKRPPLELGGGGEPSSIISINTPDFEPKKSLSTENLLDPAQSPPLRKIWSSAENLLDSPKRVERRKRQKGPAPPPPPVLQGQYVRVAVQPRPPPEQPKFAIFRPLVFKSAPSPSAWTSSMPRLLRKPKNAPMAYRYIDTTIDYPPKPAQTISNRLFGMSSKLKEFGSTQSGCNVNSKYQSKDVQGTLKSVIKKDDAKRKNEKKVTFSAYNTVQVV